MDEEIIRILSDDDQVQFMPIDSAEVILGEASHKVHSRHRI